MKKLLLGLTLTSLFSVSANAYTVSDFEMLDQACQKFSELSSSSGSYHKNHEKCFQTGKELLENTDKDITQIIIEGCKAGNDQGGRTAGYLAQGALNCVYTLLQAPKS